MTKKEIEQAANNTEVISATLPQSIQMLLSRIAALELELRELQRFLIWYPLMLVIAQALISGILKIMS